MNLTLLIVVILTAIALVGIALGVARIVSPRSYNRQKGEAYECTVQDAGIDGLINILFFMVILILGLAYAWRKGALEWK